MTAFLGKVILPDAILQEGAVVVSGDRIVAVARRGELNLTSETVVQHSGYISPGYVDLHVHGGGGADFMDGTLDAFDAAVAAHARHGTTGIVPTTTVAPAQAVLRTLEIARRRIQDGPQTARVLGVHFYGPYFGKQAAGCHPTRHLRDPDPAEYTAYLEFADVLASATIAPELPGAEAFARACSDRNIVVNLGHSHCTFDEAEAAVAWGARHVDHLYCAMSDRARMRQTQMYPMRGGLLEATLYFDELSTEVIADGKHLCRELLLLAHKIKGPDRLALVTDCSRALDLSDGSYTFGGADWGEPFLKAGGVGLMPDRSALASSVVGMDHMVRTFWQLTGCPVAEVVRMATLTPARIVRKDHLVGSLEPGKFADLLLLTDDLEVTAVFVGGRRVA